MNSNQQVKEFWEEFLKSDPTYDQKYRSRGYTAWAFGIDPQMADDLLALVLDGTKRGTASLLDLYIDEPVPHLGELSIILDSQNNPRCIIETVKVDIVKFKDVTEEFAAIEGEGDRSLKYWRDAHIYCFTEEVKEHDAEFTEDSLTVCEQIELVYQK